MSAAGDGPAADPEEMQAEGEFGGHEEQKPGTPAKVRAPTKLEQEDHENSGHARYRNWCPHCVAAKGQGNPHKTADDNPSELPEVGFDYFYLGDRQSTGLPNVAAKDRRTGSFGGTTLERKGRNDYATAYLVGWVRGLGYKRLIARSDNEPSILALLRDVSASLPEVEMIFKSSPEGDHQANGLAEVGVREVKAQARVLKSELESHYGRRFGADEPILAWLVRHGANVMNRGRIGADGRTPEQRRVGKKWQRPTVLFGETCFFKPTCGSNEDKPRGGEARMNKGVYVGHHERTGAALLLTPEGMRRGSGLTRLPVEDRFNDEFLRSCKGLPWDVKPRQRTAPGQIDLGVGERAAPLPDPEARRAREEVQPRRRYITLAEIERYGGTDGCIACTKMALGERGARGAHKEECRARFDRLWAEDESTVAAAKREADALRRGDAEERIGKKRVKADQGTSESGRSGGAKADQGASETVESGRASNESVAGAAASSSGVKRVANPSETETGGSTGSDGGWQDLADKLKRARSSPESEEPSRGSKRAEPDGGHLDEDVDVRTHRGQVDHSDQSGAAGGGGNGALEPSPSSRSDRVEAVPSGTENPAGEQQPEDADMSIGKMELVPAIRRELRRKYLKEGVAATEGEIEQIARVCAECCACDVAEIYTPPRFTPKCGEFGLRPGFCVDLTTTKPDGEHWDLSKPSDVEALENVQRKEQPHLLVGSPPCTTFCPLLRLRSGADEIRERQQTEGEPHMRVAVAAYWRQLEAGRHFLHEHPAGSASWRMPEVEQLASDERVHIVQGPMCRWGMTAQDAQGTGYVRKETKWMTSSPEVAAALQAVCTNFSGGPWHRHVRLMGGNRAALAATYPPKLVAEVLRSFAKTLRREHDMHAFAAGPHNDEPELPGGEWDDEVYIDDVKGGVLDPVLVKAGRAEEMDWIMKQKVFMEVPIETAIAEQGKIHDMKWVETQKGSKVRCRLVVREIKARKREHEKLDPATVFAAMPPVEGIKGLISHMQTEKTNSRGEELEMMVLDISRAHFYGEARRRVFTTLPEGYEKPGYCALLLKTMYGTEDAASVWQDTWTDHLRADAIEIGKASTALFAKGLDLKGLCHGDDFVVVASRGDLEAFESHLRQRFDVRRTGHVGYASDCDSETDVLKRTIRIDRAKRVIELEADPRHVESLLEQFNLRKCKPALTPRVKIDEKELARITASPALDRDGRTQYRSATMRAAYLAVDRPDISETVKVLSQAMSQPKEGHLAMLKRLVRYLAGSPRMTVEFVQQEPKDAMLEVLVDSDWAGDVGCRRSTSGMVVMRGAHLLRHSSTLQAAIGLSSAEAEYYALVRGACYGLGMQAYYADWHMQLALRVHSDSSSARAFAKRQGLGKQRHVMTRFLWLQERVKLRHLEIRCVEGTQNPADLLTKALSRHDAERHLKRMNVRALMQTVGWKTDEAKSP